MPRFLTGVFVAWFKSYSVMIVTSYFYLPLSSSFHYVITFSLVTNFQLDLPSTNDQKDIPFSNSGRVPIQHLYSKAVSFVQLKVFYLRYM